MTETSKLEDLIIQSHAEAMNLCVLVIRIAGISIVCMSLGLVKVMLSPF